MSQVRVQGNASGTGTITLTSPNTNSNFTQTLPAETGTVLTTATPGVPVNGPAFFAYLNQTQSITANTYTKVQLNGELFDTASAFDTSTYKFTPQVAGYYQVNAQAASLTVSYSGDNLVAIYKNGTAYVSGYVGTYGIPNISQLVYLNGSTDYLELYVVLGTSQNITASSRYTYLSGALVRAA